MVEVGNNLNCYCQYSDLGIFGTASLLLWNCTSSATKNSSINWYQILLMVQVKLELHESYECTVLIDTIVSFSFILQ